jgi:hypothetical protein
MLFMEDEVSSYLFSLTNSFIVAMGRAMSFPAQSVPYAVRKAEHVISVLH